MIIDAQGTIISELSAFPDWNFPTPGDQGPGLGPVPQPTVFLQGHSDTPSLLAGRVSNAQIQPRIFDERDPWNFAN